jgi:hypothetical protein
MATREHIDKLYRYQVENHRRIVESLDVLEHQLRRAIATQDRKTQSALLPLYVLLLGSAAEARLMKIVLEPKAFSSAQVSTIMGASSQVDRWSTLVRLAFLKHAGNFDLDAEVTLTTVGRSNELLYKDICNHIVEDLRSVIELRNKMAHGQWSKPMVNWSAPYFLRDLRVSEEHIKMLKRENLMTLILKRGMTDRILDIIRDLAISQIAFKRDYDEHYKRIHNRAIQLKTRDYNKYASNLINRFSRGRGHSKTKS